MGYRITIDDRGCFNCGVCMDVCPVQALDMSRPAHGGPETGSFAGTPLKWMMEFPTQVGECIGCGICVRECPVLVVRLDTITGETPLAPRQGPITRPVPATEPPAWIPLGEATREALKPDHPEPFSHLFAWRTSERPQPWQTWRSMVEADADPKAP